MSNHAKRRASRLRKFTDYDAEYRETGSREAAVQRDRAMREGTLNDFVYAREMLNGRLMDDRMRRKELLRKIGMSGFRPRERRDDG